MYTYFFLVGSTVNCSIRLSFTQLRSCNEITLKESDTVQHTDKDIFPPLPGLFGLFGCFLDIGQSLQFGQREGNCNYLLRGKRIKPVGSLCYL